MEEEIPSIYALSIFADIIKDIKKSLPRTCTFLSPLKTREGEYQILSIINKIEYRLTVPSTLKFTQGDINEIESILSEKC